VSVTTGTGIYRVPVNGGTPSLLTSTGPAGGYTLAFDANGVLFAGTQMATPTAIYTVDTLTGAFTLFATLPVSAGDWGSGMWFDPSGNLYFNSASDTTVYKVTPAGVVSPFIRGDGHLALNGTQGTCDASGNIYIPSLSTSPYQIFQYSPSGTYTRTLTPLCAPWGSAVAEGYLVYVCDTATIYLLDLASFTNFTSPISGLTSLSTLSVDASTNFYMAGWGGQTLYKFTSGGTELWNTVVGTGASVAF
jgi:hypothetical protein